jgi:hypothetical protein
VFFFISKLQLLLFCYKCAKLGANQTGGQSNWGLRGLEENRDNNVKGTIQVRVNRRITFDNMEVPNRPQQSTRLTICVHTWTPACYAHTVLAKGKNGFSSWMVRIVLKPSVEASDNIIRGGIT